MILIWVIFDQCSIPVLLSPKMTSTCVNKKNSIFGDFLKIEMTADWSQVVRLALFWVIIDQCSIPVLLSPNMISKRIN